MYGYQRVSTHDGDAAVSNHGVDSHIPLLPPSDGLDTAEAEEIRVRHGLNGATPKFLSLFKLLLCCMAGPLSWLAWLAAGSLLADGRRLSGGIVIGTQVSLATLVGLQFVSLFAVVKRGVLCSRDLEEDLRVTARRDAYWQSLSGDDVVPGDLLLLSPGMRVPADCTIDTVVEANEAILTGESLPIAAGPHHLLRSGAIVVQGSAHATVQLTGASSFSGRVLEAMRSTVKLPNRQHVAVSRMAMAIGLGSLIVGVLSGGFQLGYSSPSVVWEECLQTVLLWLQIFPLGFGTALVMSLAQAARRMATLGVVPLRLSSVFTLGSMNCLFSDKTGTLTMNSLAIQDYCPVFDEAYDRERVLLLAALSLRWREPVQDALDAMVLGAADLTRCDAYVQLDFVPFSHETRRTEATVRGPDGHVFQVTKGTANAVLQMLANREALRPALERTMDDIGRRGVRCVMVAHTDAQGEWRAAGLLAFIDPIRPDAREAIRRLDAYGIPVTLLTGDHPIITREISRQLGLGTAVATADMLPRVPAPGSPNSTSLRGDNYGCVIRSHCAFADVRPEEKLAAVEVMQQGNYTVGMLGDGINDIPAMHQADVSLAVGATVPPQVLAVADVVAAPACLEHIVDAVVIARDQFWLLRAVLQFRTSASLHLALFHVVGCPIMKTVFSQTDSEAAPLFRLPSTLSVALAATVILLTVASAKERVGGLTGQPQSILVGIMLYTSLAVAVVGAVSSTLLLWVLTDSTARADGSWCHLVGIPPIPPEHMVLAMWMQLTWSVALPAVCFTAGSSFCLLCTQSPRWTTLGVTSLTLAATTVVALVMPPIELDGVAVSGLLNAEVGSLGWVPLWVAVWSVCWWLVQDVLKVVVLTALGAYGLVGVVTGAEAPVGRNYRQRAKPLSFIGDSLHVERRLIDL